LGTLSIQDLRGRGGGPYNLTIAPGECVGLSGPSGSGKTLMLRAIVDLDPHEGQVLLGTQASHDVKAPLWREQVAMLPSEILWWFDIVRDHFSAVNGTWLSALGFNKAVLEKRVSLLSTGERQRLGLVRMISGNPRALLLDEPTASLDDATARQVEDLVAAYRKEHDAPVLWVGHDANQLSRVASRRFFMQEGVLTPGEDL
jgi:ABC-type iron transport system FetAB ATPase subunit